MTGVQTCALPISPAGTVRAPKGHLSPSPPVEPPCSVDLTDEGVKPEISPQHLSDGAGGRWHRSCGGPLDVPIRHWEGADYSQWSPALPGGGGGGRVVVRALSAPQSPNLRSGQRLARGDKRLLSAGRADRSLVLVGVQSLYLYHFISCPALCFL